MQKMSAGEKKEILRLVGQLESTTCAEVLPIVLKASGPYPEISLTLGILGMILVPLVLFFSPLDLWHPLSFLLAQIPGFALGYAFGEIPGVRRVFLRKKVIQNEVQQKASELYLKHNLHQLKTSTGVLIFLSILERKALILMNGGPLSKFPVSGLQNELKKVAPLLREGKTYEALRDLLTNLAVSFQKIAPRTNGSSGDGEIPNTLIES